MEFEREKDMLDIASGIETAERDACVARACNQPKMQATGFCRDQSCGAPLPPGQLFCGTECRDFFEKKERMRRIQGK
jgi:predicted nucleic acid-binding Zn ribbon protein